MISANIYLLDTQTGLTTEYDSEVDPESVEFTWSEGNYSCDCNRTILFARATGLWDDYTDGSCGEGRFKVRITVVGSDKVLYSEL